MWWVFWAVCCGGVLGCVAAERIGHSEETASRQLAAVKRMISASEGVLRPVYGPLAEYIVEEFGLAQKEGVGLDIGSGPGTLIVELCKRSRLRWVNVDINPYFFEHFYREAVKAGVAHQVGAIAADVHRLPFRDGWADVVVSRGSYHFWKDKVRAFGEIYRVLKVEGVAYVGRGFSKNLPVEVARQIRAKQGRRIRYDVDAAARELREVMEKLGIKRYRIERPGLGIGVNYGLWVTFWKQE